MKKKEALEEVIWIERTKNSLTYREIAEKLDITIYKVKKVLHARTKKEKGK